MADPELRIGGVARCSNSVSVVIPLYNKAGTIRRAIDSVLSQQGVDAEVIVIDDGSNDGSSDQLSIYGNQITVRRQSNAGPSAARNEGAKLARHALLAFLDADDELLPGCLSAHVACRHEQPETKISLMSFRVMQGDVVDREETLTERVATIPREFIFIRHPVAAAVINVHVGAICVDRDLFDGGASIPSWAAGK